MVPHARIQPTMDCVALQYLLLKKIHMSVDLCNPNPCCSRVNCILFARFKKVSLKNIRRNYLNRLLSNSIHFQLNKVFDISIGFVLQAMLPMVTAFFFFKALTEKFLSHGFDRLMRVRLHL